MPWLQHAHSLTQQRKRNCRQRDAGKSETNVMTCLARRLTGDRSSVINELAAEKCALSYQVSTIS